MLRDSDVFARLGGDEFTLLLPETGRAEAVLAKLRARLREAMEGEPAAVTLSFGIVTRSGDDDAGEDPLAAADALMYEAERAGKDRARFEDETSQRGPFRKGRPPRS